MRRGSSVSFPSSSWINYTTAAQMKDVMMAFCGVRQPMTLTLMESMGSVHMNVSTT